jgi:hypothetical protein
MATENAVRIVEWPKEPARLEHHFELDKPCPVSILFDQAPAHVVVSPLEQPLNIDMQMSLKAREPIPVCIKLCEPICAKSDYTIGITIFDRPVATINVRGLTRLFACQKEEF